MSVSPVWENLFNAIYFMIDLIPGGAAMIQRYLEDDWFEPAPPAFLEAIAEDPELQVEIRQNTLTVYYRGAALIRHLRFNDGQIGGEIHYKYIPLIQPNASDYVSVSLQDEGLFSIGKLDHSRWGTCRRR